MAFERSFEQEETSRMVHQVLIRAVNTSNTEVALSEAEQEQIRSAAISFLDRMRGQTSFDMFERIQKRTLALLQHLPVSYRMLNENGGEKMIVDIQETIRRIEESKQVILDDTKGKVAQLRAESENLYTPNMTATVSTNNTPILEVQEGNLVADDTNKPLTAGQKITLSGNVRTDTDGTKYVEVFFPSESSLRYVPLSLIDATSIVSAKKDAPVVNTETPKQNTTISNGKDSSEPGNTDYSLANATDIFDPIYDGKTAEVSAPFLNVRDNIGRVVEVCAQGSIMTLTGDFRVVDGIKFMKLKGTDTYAALPYLSVALSPLETNNTWGEDGGFPTPQEAALAFATMRYERAQEDYNYAKRMLQLRQDTLVSVEKMENREGSDKEKSWTMLKNFGISFDNKEQLVAEVAKWKEEMAHQQTQLSDARKEWVEKGGK